VARPAVIDEPLARWLAAELRPISEDTLRRLIRATGLPMTAVVEGVRQDSLEELERTLGALALEYAARSGPGTMAVRRPVLRAKRHAQFTLKRSPESTLRREVVLWIDTWLYNPPLFPAWVLARRRATATPGSEP